MRRITAREKNYFLSKNVRYKDFEKASGEREGVSGAEINWKMQFKLIEKLKEKIVSFNAARRRKVKASLGIDSMLLKNNKELV